MKLKKLLLSTILTVTILLPATTVSALTTPYTTKRLGGQTRFETAIEISKEFAAKTKKSVDSVILCSAYGYADSVSVTPFAVYVNAPILLTDQNTLTQSTKDRISEMNVKKAYVIGGTAAISDNVISQLSNMGLTVERIGGTNRFQTNQAILAKIPEKLWGKSPKFVNAYDPYYGLAITVDTIDKDNTELINPIIFYSNTVDGYHSDSINNKNIITTLSKKYGDAFTPYISYSGYPPAITTRIYPVTYYDKKQVTVGYLSTDKNEKALLQSTMWINSELLKKFNIHPCSTNSVMLTTGDYYIDAIAAGPLSAITYSPITFLDKKYSRYSEWKYKYVDVQNIYYVGGQGVVPDGSESIIK